MSEVGNHAIRKVVVSTGAVTTLAGLKGTSGFADGVGTVARFDFPNAIFGDSNFLYIVDDRNHAIRRMTISTNEVVTFSGWVDNSGFRNGTGALTSSPQAAVREGTNTLPNGFIFEKLNPSTHLTAVTRSVVVTGTPTLTTVSPNTGARGAAVTITLTGTGFVSGGTTVAVSGSGSDVTVSGVSVSSTTSLTATFTVTSGATLSGRTVTVTTGAGTSGSQTFTVVAPAPTVTSISPTSGVQGSTTPVTITGTNLIGATSVNVSGSGGVLVSGFTVVSSTQIDAVLILNESAITRTVTVTTSGGTSGSQNFTITTSSISGASSVTTSVLAGSTTSGNTDATGTAARFSFPGGTWGDGKGNLYIADTSNHTIRKIVLSSGVVTTSWGSGSSGSNNGTGTSATFNSPEGLWGDGLGSLYVADTGNHLIRKINISSGVVTTLAGTGSATPFANGTGTSASFNEPHAIWGDAATLYVADKSNHVIRKIVVSTGAVTTFAGTAGSSGSTDASGTSASFNLPLGIWGNGSNLWVTEGGNHTIRQIVISNQAVTTFAGVSGTSGSNDGTGTGAKFNFPHAIWGDGTHMWVVDLSNHAIRKVVISSKNVTTVAGLAGSTGSTDGTGTVARFTSPQTIWGDGLNLYVSGGSNNLIRKLATPPPAPAITSISPTSGKQGATVNLTITGTDFSGTSVDVSGTGVIVPSFTVDSATQITATLVLSGATGARNVTVTTGSGTSNSKSFTINTSPVTSAGTLAVSRLVGADNGGLTDGTGTGARFNEPTRVWSDGTNLYISDLLNNVIRKLVISSGAVTTLAGKPGTSGTVDGTGTAARFDRPAGIWGDGSGNLYVADTNSDSIRKVVISTGAVTTFAGSTTGVDGTSDGTGTAARFDAPRGIWGDATHLYVADTDNNTIRKIVISSALVSTFAGTADVSGSVDATGASAQFNRPYEIVGDSSSLYVTDRNNHTIRKIVISSAEVTTLAGTAGSFGSTDDTGAAARFQSPIGITLEGGDLYVVGASNDTVRKIVPGTGVVTTLAGTVGSGFVSLDGTGTSAKFGDPEGIIGDGAGNLYVAETGSHTIRKVVISSAVVTTIAGVQFCCTVATDGTGAAASFNNPKAIWGDGAGNLYVAAKDKHAIRKVVISTGVVTTLAGTLGSSRSTDGTGAAARFNDPQGIWSDGINVYVVDTKNHTIRKIVIATGVVTTLAGTAGSSGSTDATGAAARFTFPRGLWGDGVNRSGHDSRGYGRFEWIDGRHRGSGAIRSSHGDMGRWTRQPVRRGQQQRAHTQGRDLKRRRNDICRHYQRIGRWHGNGGPIQ